MKRLLFVLAALLLLFSALPVSASNDAPNGPHYNLNIIAVNPKTADMSGANGHVIFVNDNGKSNIYLLETPQDIFDFQVLDANGTDNNGASFQLPNPDPDCNGTTWYSVYVRVVGKPHTTGTLQSCVDEGTDGTWCATDLTGGVEPIDLQRPNKPKFVNQTKNLLYVDICTAVDLAGNCTAQSIEPLFGTDGYNYWWETDITGKKTVQLRFYQIPYEAWPSGSVSCPTATPG